MADSILPNGINLSKKISDIGDAFGKSIGIPQDQEDFDQTHKQNLQYPLYDIGEYPMFVTFRPLQKVNADLKKETAAVEQKQAENQGTSFLEDLLSFNQRSQNTQFGANSKTLAKSKTTASGSNIVKGERVRLYMPAAIQFQDGMQYNNFALGALGEAARRAGGDVGMLARTTVEDTVGAITSIVNDINSDVAAVGTARRLNKAGFDKAGAAVSSAFGVTVNPNTRAMFEGVAVRSFSFSFQLIASNEEEANAIEAIVKYFRIGMYPETIALDGIPIGYRYPSKWEIQFWDSKIGGNPILHKLKPAYLASMNTVYNSGDAVFHEDGKPTSVEISMTFTEEAPLDRSDIKKGY